jgi:hypothetical protein
VYYPRFDGMQRKKRITKRERKAQNPSAAAGDHQHQHIHCISCGTHLDPAQFEPGIGGGPSAATIRCQHGSTFPTCTGCAEASRRILEEHDRTGQPPKVASAWH